METDCNLNCDSILKKAKWLIIAACVWEICVLLSNELGIISWILYDVFNHTGSAFIIYPILTANSIPYLLSTFLFLIAYLYLRKHPNLVFKRTANILLFALITINTFNYPICYLLYILGNIIIPQIVYFIIGVLFTFFQIMAYANLLNSQVIRKTYISPIYILCLGAIIPRFISHIPYTIFNTIIPDSSKLWDFKVYFFQTNNIASLILGLAGYILIIFGWKQLLSTPSQIPTTTSGTPISLKPTKIEYGYLVSCGVLIALLFIYFNSVSLDIFTK